uniref:Uncharacterized protein n=1 Tax=Sparus aurata TaxID=8175 RepID=A0A671Z2F6_SPAAU
HDLLTSLLHPFSKCRSEGEGTRKYSDRVELLCLRAGRRGRVDRAVLHSRKWSSSVTLNFVQSFTIKPQLKPASHLRTPKSLVVKYFWAPQALLTFYFPAHKNSRPSTGSYQTSLMTAPSCVLHQFSQFTC